ncbi:MAG: hypothetical protein GX548_01640 [Lentisphaerae bacterium]|nr:hypothetical protein [Lentisphaerota bacterium]
MNIRICIVLAALTASALSAAAFQTEWAYHSAGDSARLQETVPGRDIPFLANASQEIPDADPVTLYVITAHNFAGDPEEQIFVRWWDGAMAHWIMGVWVDNITVSAEPEDARFRGEPSEGTLFLDLWKIVVPAWITQPGQNYYAIQLKAFQDGDSESRYLVQQVQGGFSRTNRFGQIWSASEEVHGQDWSVRILP